MSVTQLPLVKQWLRITHSKQDLIVQMLIDGAESFLAARLNVAFTSQEVTEDLSADASDLPTYPNPRWNWTGGQPFLSPTRLPVTAVTEVLDHRDSDSAQNFLLKDDLVYHCDQVSGPLSGVWPAGLNRYAVTYTGGFDTLPGALLQAVCMLTARMYKARGGETMLKTFDQAASFGAFIDSDIERLIQPFSRRRMLLG